MQDGLIDQYRVKRFLGREKGCQTYLAAQEGLASPLLLKLFSPDPANRHLWERAWQEIHLLSIHQHTSILPVLNCIVWNPESSLSTDSLQKPGFLVIVYQYAPVYLYYLIPGKSSRKLNNTEMAVQRLLHIIEQIASALTLAHSLGIVHGALDPGNIVLNAQLDHVWVADFALARLRVPQQPLLAPELIPVSHLCEQRGNVAPYWEGVTAASDQYTLAVICYQLLLHTLPRPTFQRVLPILRHASQARPEMRFPRISDFFHILALAFGSDRFAGFESETQQHPYQLQGLEEGVKGLFSPLKPLSTDSPSATLIQQTNHLEYAAGKYFLARDYQAAAQAYMQASHLNPGSASAWLGMADACFALERYVEALQSYGKALELDPSNPDAWFNRATTLELIGRSDQALLDYERAERLRAEADRSSS